MYIKMNTVHCNCTVASNYNLSKPGRWTYILVINYIDTRQKLRFPTCPKLPKHDISSHFSLDENLDFVHVGNL